MFIYILCYYVTMLTCNNIIFVNHLDFFQLLKCQRFNVSSQFQFVYCLFKYFFLKIFHAIFHAIIISITMYLSFALPLLLVAILCTLVQRILNFLLFS